MGLLSAGPKLSRRAIGVVEIIFDLTFTTKR